MIPISGIPKKIRKINNISGVPGSNNPIKDKGNKITVIKDNKIEILRDLKLVFLDFSQMIKAKIASIRVGTIRK